MTSNADLHLLVSGGRGRGLQFSVTCHPDPTWVGRARVAIELASVREQISTFTEIPSCPPRTSATDQCDGPPTLDGLREREDPVRVVFRLDLSQPGQVGAVVGLPPVGQGRVDVVLVRLAAGEGA